MHATQFQRSVATFCAWWTTVTAGCHRFAMTIVAFSILIAPAVRADVFVIANPSADISAEDIRDVFVGDKLLATGVKLIPVDNTVAQAEFLNKVLTMDIGKYNAIWTRKGLQDGLNPPDMKISDEAVIVYVRRTPGAIGYVTSLGKVTTGFKTIKRF